MCSGHSIYHTDLKSGQTIGSSLDVFAIYYNTFRLSIFQMEFKLMSTEFIRHPIDLPRAL